MSHVKLIIEGILGVIGLFLMWRILFPFRPSQPARPLSPSSRPRLSVVIPARNEERQIGRLLRSLQKQSTPPDEIIVVDDESTDATATVARAEGAQVLVGAPLPAGWNGKSWACWQGASLSAGELLLFLDADTWLEPAGLERLLALYEGSGLLTVQPYHMTEKPYEQLSAFFNIIIMASVGAFTPLGERVKPGGAFGPCILCDREEYQRVGGHADIHHEMLEDIPLAKLFSRHGLPVRCYAGRGILSFRMYAAGWPALVEGWTKGMGYGAFSVNPLFSLLTTAWIAGCFGAFDALLTALRAPADWPAWITYLAYALFIGRLLHGIGRFQWWAAVFFPVPLCFFGLIVVRSLLLTYLRKRVVWKGRALPPAKREK